jgi:subtilisin family serine protease
VLLVGSVDAKDARPVWANYGPGIDVAAPGEDILSLRAHDTDLLLGFNPSYPPGGAFVGEGYYRFSGSAAAGSHAAGVAALVWAARPELTAQQLRRLLRQTARDVGSEGRDNFTGFGVLDVPAALVAPADQWIEADVSSIQMVLDDERRSLLRVFGTADADTFGRAWFELGWGESPGSWERLGEELPRPVTDGRLADLPTDVLRGRSGHCCLRLVVERGGGRRRAFRYGVELTKD